MDSEYKTLNMSHSNIILKNSGKCNQKFNT